MAVTARKYNPGFLTDDELVASFCVRTAEFEALVEILRECTGNSNPHQIVTGPRGSGKTSLLLRVAAAVRRDAELSSRFFPVVFAEESYEVATAGDFWLECLGHLADQTPRREDAPDLRRSYEELRTVRDDQVLAERCLGALLDFSDQEGKRLALIVENLNMMFSDMADPEAGWRLRKILQTEPRIILLASATSRFDEIDNPERAMYDLFQVRSLRPLETSECAVLWETVAGRCPPPETIRSLQILTGGSPRLIVIAARFGTELSFRKLMDDLLDLVDNHTEYFKSHLDSLPAQERRVYLALAVLWKPATTREISDYTRIETSKCSAQLKRLAERGAVQTVGGSARRKQYYLTERLYNIYYLLRRHRRSERLVEALIRFMEAYYSPDQLKDIGACLAREAASFDAEMQSLERIALQRLRESPALAGHRDELIAAMPAGVAENLLRRLAPADVARATGMKADGNRSSRRDEIPDVEAEEMEREFLQTVAAVREQDRADEKLAACDKFLRRFAHSAAANVLPWVAIALFEKGDALRKLNRTKDALAVHEEVARRFGKSDTPAVLVWVAMALAYKAATLSAMNRMPDSLATSDGLVRRCGNSKTPEILQWVALAMLNKGLIFRRLNRIKDELAAYDRVVQRFAKSRTPAVLQSVALALVAKGTTLNGLNRTKEALISYDRVVRRFGQSEYAPLIKRVEEALLGKADIEFKWGRYQAAAETASRILDQRRAESPEKRLRGYLIRAKAVLAVGDQSQCEQDVKAVLALLPKLSDLPGESVDALMILSVELGVDRMRELIQASPSATLLLPLATALEQELGREPRVAREVEEVAGDIQRHLAQLRENLKREVATP